MKQYKQLLSITFVVLFSYAFGYLVGAMMHKHAEHLHAEHYAFVKGEVSVDNDGRYSITYYQKDGKNIGEIQEQENIDVNNNWEIVMCYSTSPSQWITHVKVRSEAYSITTNLIDATIWLMGNCK
jgi:hypothetical protein